MEQKQHDVEQSDGRYTEEDAAWFEVLGLVERLGRWSIPLWERRDSEGSEVAPEGFGILDVVADTNHSPRLEALAEFLGATYVRGTGHGRGGAPFDHPFIWQGWENDNATHHHSTERSDTRRTLAQFELLVEDIFAVRQKLRVWAEYEWAMSPSVSEQRRIRELLYDLRHSYPKA